MPRNNLAVLVLAHVKKNKNTHTQKKEKEKKIHGRQFYIKFYKKEDARTVYTKLYRKTKQKSAQKLHREMKTRKKMFQYIWMLHLDANRRERLNTTHTAPYK